MLIIILVVVAAVLLAFANGANDNAKGVATLIGSGTLQLNRAIVYAAVTTLLGSLTAVLLAGELLRLFSGKGIIDGEILTAAAFPACVGLAAGATVLIATRISMPISTTHAMVGSLVGIGMAADAVHWHAVLTRFFIPLLISPLIALAAAALLYPLFRFVRRRAGVTHETCLCVGEQVQPVAISIDGAMRMQDSGMTLTAAQIDQCRQRYDGRVVGINAQRVLDWSHYFTAGAVSFARGLNDTPKIAALLFTVSWLTHGWSLALVGVAIAAGGLLAVRRVAQTMSYRITDMNDGQAFTANLVTAVLVIFASKWGMPVSTTHVSCGSLFGIGATTKQGHWRVIGTILLAWVTTLPVAAGLGFLAWRLIGLQ